MSLALKVWSETETEMLAATVIAKDAVATGAAFDTWKLKYAAVQVDVSIVMGASIDGNATVAILGSTDGTNFSTAGTDNMGGSIPFTAGATVRKSFLVWDLYAFKVAVVNGTTTEDDMTVTITARPYRWES